MTSCTIKIALLTDGIYPYVMGGMQKHSYYLAKYLAQQKIYVDLYHYIPKENKTMDLPFSTSELEYISLLQIDYPKAKRFPGHYLYERYLYSKLVTQAFIKRKPVDFVYAKGFSAWYLLKHKTKLGITQSIGVNYHGYEMFQKWPDTKTGLKLQLLKLPVLMNMRLADYLFSYGGKISDIIKKKGHGSKIVTIPTGISQQWLMEKNNAKIEKPIKFCFVGRAERRKGIEEINKVISQFDKKNTFEFHFIGPIPEHSKISDTRVIYHGSISTEEKIKKIVQKADVLVCPSYAEGMPNVILEGMASGCAIIATDVGAVSELVNNDNGWLITPGDVSALQDAMRNALGLDKKELQKKQAISLQKVKDHFLWETVIAKTITEIKKIYLLKKPGKR